MLLSVVIVNYNVKAFLQQCLHSLSKSRGMEWGKDFEVFVVDNRSADGSVEMLKNDFPQVRLIANKENLGFAKANNQAIRQSEAKYVLLLNPDTLVEPDTLKKCLDFMESHREAGGLGVKMLDGQGHFLKESKRGLPTPRTAFYKISGLCKAFPRSERFAAYYMGHLDAEEIHEVEILSGAFMLLRKETLNKVGLLDESFFMYGEDIDLSYRILLGGYKNFYFPKTRIIHYKGESTKKGSLNYVLVFYRAMEIFAKKYFSKGLYIYGLRLAIWLRASLSMLSRLIRRLFLPVTDGLLNYLILLFLSLAWPALIRNDAFFYPEIYRLGVLPVYALLLVAGNFACRAYRLPISFKRTALGYLSGIVGFLILGALFGAQWQFSRFMAVAGGAICLGFALLLRLFAGRVFRKSFPLSTPKRKHYLIIGKSDESARVEQLLLREGVLPDHIHTLAVDVAESLLLEQIQLQRIGEVIFCARDLGFDHILRLLTLLRKTGAESKIVLEGGEARVGYKL